MKNLFLFVCIGISVSVIFSCRKEKAPNPIDYTFNFTEPVNNPQGELELDCPSSQIEFAHLDEYNYSRPLFNPTNPNEIAYLRRPWGDSECTDELWTFNFKTGRTHRVTSQKICKYDWSILNWMVFTDQSGTVWKVKPNSSELTEIRPNNNFSFLLKCNNLGDRILLDAPSLVSFGTVKNVYDFEGDFIQNIPALEFIYTERLDWHGDQIIFPQHVNFQIYNFLTDTLIGIETNEIQPFSNQNNIQFLNENEIIFTLTKSMHSMNLDTQDKTLIKANGVNDWFVQIDISIDQKTILVQKEDYVKIDECTIQVRNYLAVMDMDGSNERRILIPE